MWLSTNPEVTHTINYEEKIEKLKNTLNTWELRRLTLLGKITVLKSLAASQLVHVLSPLKTNEKTITEINQLFYIFLWNGKGDKIKRNVIIADYTDGGLILLDIASFNKALKFTWIKTYLDKENHGKWKIFFDLELDSYGKELVFTRNMSKRDASKYINLSDPFIKEVHETWTEISFENTINSMEQFRQQYLWQNSLIKIESKPIYLRNWFKTGIVQIKHIMKNASQFLSHSELQNRCDFHVCPLLYCGIIS